MSLPRWVILLMWIPSLIVLAAIWLWVSPWLAVASGIAILALDVRVLVKVRRRCRLTA